MYIELPTASQWADLSPEKKADVICRHLSESRLELFGGYPDQWAIRDVDGEKSVIRATTSSREEPELDIVSVQEFLSEWEKEVLCWIEEAAE